MWSREQQRDDRVGLPFRVRVGAAVASRVCTQDESRSESQVRVGPASEAGIARRGCWSANRGSGAPEARDDPGTGLPRGRCLEPTAPVRSVMDEFNSAGLVPASLLRWELTRQELHRPGAGREPSGPCWNATPGSRGRRERARPGQLGLKALEVVGEPLVVDAEQVQERGLEVSDVNLVPDNIVGELSGRRRSSPARFPRFRSITGPW